MATNMDLTNSLLALIVTMVGCGVWVVKALMHRSDRMIEARDQQIAQSIESLSKAVRTFQQFEKHEVETHTEIIQSLKMMNDSLKGIACRFPPPSQQQSP